VQPEPRRLAAIVVVLLIDSAFAFLRPKRPDVPPEFSRQLREAYKSSRNPHFITSAEDQKITGKAKSTVGEVSKSVGAIFATNRKGDANVSNNRRCNQSHSPRSRDARRIQARARQDFAPGISRNIHRTLHNREYGA
jgi:hypothetical protein